MNNPNPLIYVVEDEEDLGQLICSSLKSYRYEVEYCNNGEQLFAALDKQQPEICIVDLNLPDIDGMQLVKELEHREIGVIIVSGRDGLTDRVLGLEFGADDYITKPIKPKVLISKINALLRRIKIEKTTQSSEKVSIGDIIIDREEYVVIKNGEKLTLPRKEFELFSLLASKPGKVFKRDDILDKVWGNEVVVGGRTIDVHIRKLREKIGDKNFKTVKGVGYKFIINED
jgi:two-component system alkaline phosphatase synthesis response regulator PhoP